MYFDHFSHGLYMGFITNWRGSTHTFKSMQGRIHLVLLLTLDVFWDLKYFWKVSGLGKSTRAGEPVPRVPRGSRGSGGPVGRIWQDLARRGGRPRDGSQEWPMVWWPPGESAGTGQVQGEARKPRQQGKRWGRTSLAQANLQCSLGKGLRLDAGAEAPGDALHCSHRNLVQAVLELALSTDSKTYARGPCLVVHSVPWKSCGFNLNLLCLLRVPAAKG